MTPDIVLLYGPLLFGVFINMTLYGVLIVQIYFYYLTYKNRDKIWIKLVVLYLFIVESVNVGCDMHIIYEPLVKNFGSPETTTSFPTMFASEPVAVVAVSTPIQLFLAWRVWLLTKSKIIPVIISAFALMSMTGGIWTAYGVAHIKVLSRVLELHTSALLWLLSGCTADILITVTLVFTLNRRKTGFVATDDVISKLIRMTIHTGLLTTIFALGDVLCFMILPHAGVNFLFDFALSKLYSNCLLSTLNARLSLQSSSRPTADGSARQNPMSLPSRRNDGFQMGAAPKRSTYAHKVGSDDDGHFTASYDPEAGKMLDETSRFNAITSIKIIDDDMSIPLDHTQ